VFDVVTVCVTEGPLGDAPPNDWLVSAVLCRSALVRYRTVCSGRHNRHMEHGGRGPERSRQHGAELAAIMKSLADRSAEADGVDASLGSLRKENRLPLVWWSPTTDAGTERSGLYPVRRDRASRARHTHNLGSSREGSWSRQGEASWSNRRDAEEPALWPDVPALKRDAVRLGEELRSLRTSASISRAKLAGRLYWPVSKVRRIERGERLADPQEVQAWARATGAADDVAHELASPGHPPGKGWPSGRWWRWLRAPRKRSSRISSTWP
jgi:transcriptional regulator with XRE-family HTH domain